LILSRAKESLATKKARKSQNAGSASANRLLITHKRATRLNLPAITRIAKIVKKTMAVKTPPLDEANGLFEASWII